MVSDFSREFPCTRSWRGKTSSESEARSFSPSKPPPLLGHGLGVPPKNPFFYKYLNAKKNIFRSRLKKKRSKGGRCSRRRVISCRKGLCGGKHGRDWRGPPQAGCRRQWRRRPEPRKAPQRWPPCHFFLVGKRQLLLAVLCPSTGSGTAGTGRYVF